MIIALPKTTQTCVYAMWMILAICKENIFHMHVYHMMYVHGHHRLYDMLCMVITDYRICYVGYAMHVYDRLYVMLYVMLCV
jgi:hypothetical protein